MRPSAQGLIHTGCTTTRMQIGMFFPLMLLASSVNTPIDNNRSHLLVLRVRVLCELGLKKTRSSAVNPYGTVGMMPLCHGESPPFSWMKQARHGVTSKCKQKYHPHTRRLYCPVAPLVLRPKGRASHNKWLESFPNHALTVLSFGRRPVQVCVGWGVFRHPPPKPVIMATTATKFWIFSQGKFSFTFVSILQQTSLFHTLHTKNLVPWQRSMTTTSFNQRAFLHTIRAFLQESLIHPTLNLGDSHHHLPWFL